MNPLHLVQLLVEPFAQPIVQRAALGIVILGITGGLVGCWTVLYGLAYAAESIAHSALPGLVAAALLGLPLDELCNLHVPLAELWRSDASELRERVLGAPTPEAKLEAAERMLSARLARVSRAPHPVVGRAAARIEAAPERCGIGELSETLGLSRRRFEQIFRADVGMTPKAYQRLQRFRRALVRIEDAARGGWAGFALDRGYYDQAHLINEFGAHCGLTPREYLASRAGSFVNHVPITG
jgi:AraC-like DNA-binding protein